MIVDPHRLPVNRLIPPVYIEELWANGQNLFSKDGVHLSYDQNTLEINYTALSFSAPENVDLKYKLEGFDKDWIDAGKRRTAYYTNLPSGNYTFRVIASNDDGLWNEQGTYLKLAIATPPWKSWWAYGLYIAAFSFLAFGAFRFQAWQLSLKANIQEMEFRAMIAEAEQRETLMMLRAKDIETKALERENVQRVEAELQMREKNIELSQTLRSLELAQQELEKKNNLLEEANLKLREVEQLKANFTAMLIHDLKSPLMVMDTVFQFLRMEYSLFSEEILKFIKAGEDSARKMLGLVNEVLELYRTDVQQIVLNRKTISPEQFIRSCVESARIAASAESIDVTLSIEPPLPQISADLSRLERVFANILSNAIKFTSKGGLIAVKAWTISGKGIESGLQFLAVSITDTGEGIAAEYLPYLFDPYQQAQSSKKMRGVGLGLSIVKRIVAAHGGNVSVQSRLGVGSCFTVLLPAVTEGSTGSPISEEKLEALIQKSGEFVPLLGRASEDSSSDFIKDHQINLETDASILVADDNPINQKVIVKQLEKMGYKIDTVANGREAVEAALKKDYSLIFMDCHMPEMDGLEATIKIRKEKGEDIPIIAFTSNTMSSFIEECFKIGMDDLLEKPYKIADLEEILLRWLKRESSLFKVKSSSL
ncbi:MAG: response regulator [Blastocatellia bacterium]|nr:response regulator [Blastocatellia bacterium]